MRTIARDALLYAALAALMTWPLARELGAAMPVGGDNQHLAWALAWVARAIAEHPTTLFSANIFHPARQSLLFSDPNVSSALLVAPLYYATKNPALLVDALYLLSFVLCGLAASALAREWTGSDAAGVVAGIVFAFSPIRFSHSDHVQLYAFWWTPLALLGIDRFVRRGGVATLAVGILSLVGEIYASLYLAAFGVAAMALLLVARGLGQGGRVRARAVLAAAMLAIVGGALCLPLGIGYADIRMTWGATRTLAQNVRYAASPLAYVSAVPSNWVWGEALATYADRVAPWEKYLFPGAVATMLAVASLFNLRSFAARFGLALAIFAAVLSLGPVLVWYGEDTGIVLPYRWAYDYVLPFRALRGPARWSLVASLGLALAAGAGAARLRPRFALVLGALALVEAVSVPMPTWPVPLDAEKAAAYGALAEGTGPLVELPLVDDESERYEVESARTYASTLHWRPIANGYSGFAPASYAALADLESRLSPEAFARLLPSWDIRTVVLHRDELPPERRDAWAALERSGVVRLAPRTTEAAAMRTVEIVTPAPPMPRVRAHASTESPVLPGEWQALRVDFPAGDAALLDPRTIGWRRTKFAWDSDGGGHDELAAKIFCPPAIGPLARRHTMYVKTPRTAGRYRLAFEGECFDLEGEVEVSGAEATR